MRLAFGKECRATAGRHRFEELGWRPADATTLCCNQQRGAFTRLEPHAPAQRNRVVGSVDLNSCRVVSMEKAPNHPSIGGESAAVAVHLHRWPCRSHLPRALLCIVLNLRFRARQVANERVVMVMRSCGEA